MMGNQLEVLFTSALGLQPSWHVAKIELDTAKRRIQCGGCGKTTQATVLWAREGSGFTLLFEALGLSLCRELPVSEAANHLRVASKRLWRRIRHYVQAAR